MKPEVNNKHHPKGSPLRVLVVEDHKALAENLAEYLAADRYQLDFAYDGLSALHLVSVNSYDVIVLDIMLPGLSGLQVCERIREDLQCHTPVLFMTARDAIEDKESGYSLGGDDYLVKPFNMREMELRIQALARRDKAQGKKLCAGSVCFDSATFRVEYAGKGLELSGSNVRLFDTLMRAYPGLVDHETLSQAVWGIEDVDLHTLRTHIYNLRKQLKDGLGHELIKTIRGRGYRLVIPEES